MAFRDDELTDEQWVRRKIELLGRARRKYQTLATVLREILEQAAGRFAPLAIVQARAKTVASYAEKIQRKIGRYRQLDAAGRPLHPVTDLCAARVITLTLEQRDAMCRFIEDHFEIDWENSLDKSKALRVSEFGYLSVHYIVRLRPGVFPTREVPVKISKADFRQAEGLCSEIQVRTLLEHAWATISHDMSYKSSFRIPDRWQRELARVAATLEDADEAFSRIQSGLAAYAASYGSYMTEEQMRRKIAELQLVQQQDPGDAGVAHRIAKLAMCLEDWPRAIRALEPFADKAQTPLLRDLGVAMCKHYKTGSRNFRRGQKRLEEAIALDSRDSDAIASLGGTWKGVCEDKARAYYRQAFEVNPSDPFPLGNYLEYEISRQRTLSPVSLALPTIRKAVQACRDQADVGMNLPWAFYDMAKFALLLKEPCTHLRMYAKAVDVSTARWMIEKSLASVERLSVVSQEIPELEWARRFLSVARAGRQPDRSRWPRLMKRLKPGGRRPLRGPILIVTGQAGGGEQDRLRRYGQLLLEALGDFRGTVIASGAATGVGGLVGRLGVAYPRRIRTIGYVPRMIPAAAAAALDRRGYREIRRTDGAGFSPLEPLQAWIDILWSGIPACEVKLIGIGGDAVAAAEYRMALALKANVAVLQDSGGAAAELLEDPDWSPHPRLVGLPRDAMTLKAFVGPVAEKLPPNLRETFARAIHREYRRSAPSPGEVALGLWSSLSEELKDSSRQQADHILQKLRRLGYSVRKAGKAQPTPVTFSGDEIEIMAEMEHGRWCAERLRAGWRYGKKRDVSGKISPYLVPWSALSDEAKQRDRTTVRAIPALLAGVGLEIHRGG